MVACFWYAAHGGKLFGSGEAPGVNKEADSLNAAATAIGRGAFGVDR